MKCAVLFPGIGYHCDKPLLYYSQKLLKDDYEIIKVDYGKLPQKSLNEKFDEAYEKTFLQLKDFNFSKFDTILFFSKSIGTAIAARLEKELNLSVFHIFYTPIEISFEYIEDGIAFSGTKDQWVDYQLVEKECQEKGIILSTIDDANHSLETGDVETDLKNLMEVMKCVKEFIEYL